MRYFTDELWSKLNSDSQKEYEKASLEWDKNNKVYSEIFESVKNRFSKKFLKTYLSNQGFHDFQIKNIVLTHKEYEFKNPISLDIYVTDSINTFKITYKCIRKLNVNYAEVEGWGERRGFDDWGYDEFLPVDEQTLSHEILFASGSTILIHFKNGNIFVTKTK
ncbi:hypothetical protein [uncultured Clostridium sp.]|uniref:hypothetical protein n=1 Tax=uncultured Clostridium sp. TaxID=59620 RepID=UPI0028EAE19B|nr:hypothetical protein [uncultured Clostridium sp.]